MNQWYKKPITKIILVITAIVTPAAVAVSLLLMAGCAATITLEDIFRQKQKPYEESASFEELMYSASMGVRQELIVKDQMETEGKYDPDKLVDVIECGKNNKITGKNSSGLAYSLGDLIEWAEKSDWYGNKDSVVVCQRADETYYYYWMSDFKKLLKEARLSMEVDSGNNEEMEQFLTELEEGYIWQENRSLILRDEERGEIYTDFWTYGGEIFREYFAPEGAEDILDVVNNTPELNGKLSDTYDYLRNTLSNIRNMNEQYKSNSAIWEEGNTNFIYLFVNKDTKKVYTNRDAYRDYEAAEKNLEKLKQQADIRYIMVEPKLDKFQSNLDVTASEWQNYLYGYGILGEHYVAAVAVDTSYPVEDIFWLSSENYNKYAPYLNDAGKLLAVSISLFLASMIWLTLIAGRRADESGELYLNPFDHWKTELSAFVSVAPWIIFTMILANEWNGVGTQVYRYADIHDSVYFYGVRMTQEDACIIAVYAAATAVCFLVGYLSLARRIKARVLWENSILRMVFRGTVKVYVVCRDHLRTFWRHRSALWRTAAMYAVFLMVHWILLMMVSWVPLPYILLTAAVEAIGAYFLVRNAVAKDRIKKGIREIASGSLDYQFPTKTFQGGDYQDMAENLSNIGDGLQRAVEQSLRDERLKTDLITNVSHDIKTPLTSIINYVDLLKRENFEDPKIKGYLDILEMKAQRLKTLTEDVVEASKVSSGNITLEYMDVDLVEMLNQTIGEFSEKMEAKQLKVIASLPEEPAVIHVDGRRMWRVLENIFNNAAKYAMPGTRVYADLKKEGKNISFSLKNVSEQPLNFSSDELTERFIRGDVSRSTEGSGLGLSIAKSLTEMQGGKFELYLDGDLFKVTISFE